MTNAERMKYLASHRRAPKFAMGALVRDRHGRVGVVDTIFADIDAAIDKGHVGDDWYDLQTLRSRTPKTGIWYAVILVDGAVFAGEDDLVEMAS